MTFLQAKLTKEEVADLLNKAMNSFRHEECATCECYLGFLTQLEIDADQEGRQYLQEYLPPRDQTHACLGCDPCPPGILYAEYLRKKPKTSLEK
jgi:hypothetical protein